MSRQKSNKIRRTIFLFPRSSKRENVNFFTNVSIKLIPIVSVILSRKNRRKDQMKKCSPFFLLLSYSVFLTEKKNKIQQIKSRNHKRTNFNLSLTFP